MNPDECDIPPQRYEGTSTAEDEFAVWRALGRDVWDERPMEAPTVQEDREDRARGRWAS